MDTLADVLPLTVNRSATCLWPGTAGPWLMIPSPCSVPPRVSLSWRTLCGAWHWDFGSVSAAWADGAPLWKRWCTPCRESATLNTSSAWRFRTTWIPWAAWSSSIWCFPQGEEDTTKTQHTFFGFQWDAGFFLTCNAVQPSQCPAVYYKSH